MVLSNIPLYNILLVFDAYHLAETTIRSFGWFYIGSDIEFRNLGYR